MARGRAPSHHAYRGALGQTRRQIVHVAAASGAGGLAGVEIVTAIDALADPELADKLTEGMLNIVRVDDKDVALAVPVVFHDPAAELMVLVIPSALRHREIDERIAMLQRIAADSSAVPAYVREFGVVIGHDALVAYAEARSQVDKRKTDVAAREIEIDRRARDADRVRADLEVAKAELASRAAEIDRAKAEVDRARAELDKNRAELEKARSEARARVIAAAQQAPEEKTTIAAPPAPTVAQPAPSIKRAISNADETRPLPYSEVSVPEDDIMTSATNLALPAAPTVPEDFEGLSTGISPIHAAVEMDEETTDAAAIPQGSDPLTTETISKPAGAMPGGVGAGAEGAGDAWLAEAMRQQTSSFLVQGSRVRLALVATAEVARHLSANLDVRVLLYRTPDAPVVALVIGSPTAMRVPNLAQLVVLTLDVATESDRHVLTTLAKKFVLDVELIALMPDNRPRRMRRVEVVAPLGDNVAYILRAADDHTRGVAADGTPSFERACDRVLSPTFDLLGIEHADTSEFRDDKLADLGAGSQLRRAIAMARRFARPSREDYLVCTRGFPLVRWRELRRHVLEGAVTWGLWMGPELAQVAVSEGLARSRRDLVVRLQQGFEALKSHPTAFDLDDDAAEDNAKALAEEARNLGVESVAPVKKSSTTIPPAASHANGANGANGKGANGIASSGDAPIASGSIHAPTPPTGTPAIGLPHPPAGSVAVARTTSQRNSAPAIAILNTPKAVRATDELIGMLESREHRLGAAIELCDRGISAAASQIIAAAAKMSRADAVRVLGMSVKLGEAAKAPLVEGLASSKAYLRHGCALALAMLRTEDGTQAVIDLLLSEPTEIWREVARAVGQVGPTALMPLASNYGRLGERATPQLAERVAWAMAHVGVRGGKPALETMGNGQSIVAPVARKALELISMAARDEVRVRPADAGQSQPGRDVTINRAFSRRFFEALEQGVPEEGQAALAQLDASSQMEMLDESDLIEDDDAVEEVEDGDELDESDLIQP